MKSTTTFEKWDIVLVSFPFTDLRGVKKRPALIVSPNQYNSHFDVVIAFITSKLDSEYRPGDYRIQEWKKAHLPKPSQIRMKFATIDKAIIVKKIGTLSRKDRQEFQKLLLQFFGD